MVKPLHFLLIGLSTLFISLTFWLLSIQLPDTGIISALMPNDDIAVLLIQSYTLPRICIALLSGGILGLTSSLLQQVMNNALASDNTLGISAGAQFALFLTAIFAPGYLAYGSSLIALVGAGLSLLLVLSLAMRKTMPPLLLILAGLVVNLYFGAFSGLMLLFYPEEARGLAQWGAGSLVQESWRDTLFLGGQALPAILLLVLLIRPLSLLSLNESNAKSLGVPVHKLRFIGVLISAYLIACVVSAVGMLGFIGLASATFVRQLGVRTFKAQIISSFIIGALLLSITDLALQLMAQYQGMHLPTGAVTALLGTPLLLWLMFRSMAQVGRLSEHCQSPVRPFKAASFWLILAGFLLITWIALSLGRDASGWVWLNFDKLCQGIFDLRYPRILTAFSVGMLLAVAGVLLQRLTLNVMASPELLGVSSGTSMGILVVIFMFSSIHQPFFFFAGVSGAVLALMILFIINQRNGMLPEKILLTGISLSAFFDTLQRLVISNGDPRANQLIAWTSGSTQQLQSELALPFFILSLGLVAVSLLFSRWLELLALQATIARALGLNLKHTRIILILFSAVLTAMATLVIGPLSFIGLLVPHLTRFLGVYRARNQILISALLGALIMVFSDWLGRQLLFPYEIPAGLVATLIGGSYFLLSVRKV